MKYFLAVIFLVLSIQGHAAARGLMMVSDDFMWPEYQVPRSLYEAAGLQVVTAGRFKESVSPDRRNYQVFADARPIKMDLSFDEVKVDEFDAITFVGGNGAWHDFFPIESAHRVL